MSVCWVEAQTRAFGVQLIGHRANADAIGSASQRNLTAIEPSKLLLYGRISYILSDLLGLFDFIAWTVLLSFCRGLAV